MAGSQPGERGLGRWQAIDGDAGDVRVGVVLKEVRDGQVNLPSRGDGQEHLLDVAVDDTPVPPTGGSDGEEALHRLEEAFYARALSDPVLKDVFTERVATHVDHLTWFTAESFGGPDRFSREVGFQHIIDVHRHREITDVQRDRFIALYLEVLDEAGLPGDESFREAVRQHVEFGARVAQQNSWARTDADLHPIRAVPIWQWPA